MFGFLAKIFIKDYKNYSDIKVREKYGLLSGIFGICLNVCLFIAKFIAGIVTGAISVTADAFNNLTDAASSLITYIGFKLSNKPTDRDHPFGHGRMEYVAGFIVSMLIFMVGFELIKSSVEQIFNPAVTEFSYLSVGILLASVAVKFYMFFYNSRVAAKIDSSAMRAVARDSITDCVATLAVLISLVLFKLFAFQTDAYCGLLVALFIIFNGYKSAKETIGLLLGEAPDPEFVKEIRNTVLSYSSVIGVHDLMVHNYGPGRQIISLHAEIDAKSDILEAHDNIDNIEKMLEEKYKCIAVIHMDPVAVGDKLTDELKLETRKAVREVNPLFDIHDFRLVDGKTHKNLVFDVTVPVDCNIPDGQIKQQISQKIKNISPDYNVVCQVEKTYSDF